MALILMLIESATMVPGLGLALLCLAILLNVVILLNAVIL